MRTSDAHTLRSGWYMMLPHPKRFTRRNADMCPICGMLLGYHYYQKRYGADYAVEVSRCGVRNKTTRSILPRGQIDGRARRRSAERAAEQKGEG